MLMTDSKVAVIRSCCSYNGKSFILLLAVLQTGRPDGMDYAYNNGMSEQLPQASVGQQPTFNGGTAPVRNLPVNKPTRGLPIVLPDPAVMQQQFGHNNMMMNADPNNPYQSHPSNAVGATQPPTTAPTSAPLSSHFSFFGMGSNNQQQQQQPQQSTGPSLIQKMMGGGGGATAAAPAATNTAENPVEGLLSKGKDLIFKKFGL